MVRKENLRFVKIGSEEIQQLSDISLETFTQSFYKLNTPENFEAYTSIAFSIQTLMQELGQENTSFYFVYDVDELVAYFKINFKINHHYQSDPDSVELQRIYVRDGVQSSGLGHYILEYIFDLGKRGGYKNLWLGVWENNLRAIRFYEKQGFLLISKHDFMLGQDQQTDYLYSRDL